MNKTRRHVDNCIKAATFASIAILFAGCAAETRLMTPVDPNRFRDKQGKDTAFNLANAKCRAKALQAGASAQPAPPPAQVNIYAQNPLAPPPINLAEETRKQQALYLQNQLIDATYMACMADEGWLQTTAKR
jgi:hypothetical protein